MVEFLRRTGNRFSKLGKGRKKKQKWRKPTGRDNKMREKRKGYPAVVKIGYKQDKKLSGVINEKMPMMIMNIRDLEKIKKNDVGIIGKVGQKKKIEIAKIAKEKKIKIYNLNAGKFLRHQAYPKISGAKKIEKTEKKNQIPAPKKVSKDGTKISDETIKGKTKLENNKDESKK